MTVWKPEPHLILDTERRGEEVLYACGFHRCALSVVDRFQCLPPPRPRPPPRPPSLVRRGNGGGGVGGGEFRGGCFPAVHCLFNAGQHSFEILSDLQVCKPQDLDAEALHVSRALPVIRHRFWGVVRIPIDLDRKLRPWRVEVEDVGIDAILPAELRAEVLASEVLP